MADSQIFPSEQQPSMHEETHSTNIESLNPLLQQQQQSQPQPIILEIQHPRSETGSSTNQVIESTSSCPKVSSKNLPNIIFSEEKKDLTQSVSLQPSQSQNAPSKLMTLSSIGSKSSKRGGLMNLINRSPSSSTTIEPMLESITIRTSQSAAQDSEISMTASISLDKDTCSGIPPPPKKTLSILASRNSRIKFSNSISKETQMNNNDFRDDGPLRSEPIPFQHTSNYYNLAQNLSISIRTINSLVPSVQSLAAAAASAASSSGSNQNNSNGENQQTSTLQEGEKEEEEEFIRLPVLLSIRTEDLDFLSSPTSSSASSDQNEICSETTSEGFSEFANNSTTFNLNDFHHRCKNVQERKQQLVFHSASQSLENHHHLLRAPLRFSIDLICVIDTSGSMSGEPLNLVKSTLLFLVDLLQKGDRICLVQFSTNAKRVTPLISVEFQENIDLIKQEINNLSAKGGTNINHGMQIALDVLKQRRQKNPITSVFLLSDGLDDGAENRILSQLQQQNLYQNYTEDNFTIQTFGFGQDHDPNLMDKIAQLMDGNFYYIGDIHRIDECFIDALGALFSVVSQNVQVIVQVPELLREKVRIVKVYGDKWKELEEKNKYKLNINQFLSGVSKDYILEIEFDPWLLRNAENNTLELLEAELKAYKITNAQGKVLTGFLTQQISPNDTHLSIPSLQVLDQPSPNSFDCLTDSQCLHPFEQNQIRQSLTIIEAEESTTTFERVPIIQTCSIPELCCPPDEGIARLSKTSIVSPTASSSRLGEITKNAYLRIGDSQLNQSNSDFEQLVQEHFLRVRSAESLEKCEGLAKQKKFEEGLEVTSQILAEIQQQTEIIKAHLQPLITNLTEAQETLRQRIAESFGWKRMLSCKRIHMEQRSTGTDICYQNSVQKLLVHRRKSIKDIGIAALLPTHEQFKIVPISIQSSDQQTSIIHEEKSHQKIQEKHEG